MSKNLKSKVVTGLIATTTLASFVVPSLASTVSASEIENPSNPLMIQPLAQINEVSVPKLSDNYSTAFKSLINKGMFNEFQLNSQGILIDFSIDNLNAKYNLSADEIFILQSIMKGNQEVQKSKQQRISFSSGSKWVRVNFTYADTVSILSSAAQIGPAALYAAIVGISGVIGPAGPILTSVLGIIGAAGLVDGCYTILRAVGNKRGVYLEAGLDGMFPYVDFGIA